MKWRQRVGVDGVEALLRGVIRIAMSQQMLKQSEIAHVNVDTTVQEKRWERPPMRACTTKPDEHWCVPPNASR
ncbi:hypothetical protein ACQ4M4_21950 [Leptolyngbya sp. AN02str]|uniref:hypothetical protein n=1 Tax=Leptolyngbya sp. AN02str TaxID=3423363 RepID=UPI003D317FAE